MSVLSNELKITSFVVKIVSKCNINCDYCYVYKHVDQSFKNQPVRLNKAHITLFARRIDDYLSHSGVDQMRICLHGGEPLLAGVRYLDNFFATLQQNIRQNGKVRLAIQTNAVLLNREFLDLFRKYGVGVSLSLDGPRASNDKHRLDHQGQSTYEKVVQAISLLKAEYPELFLGVISVIDPTNDPREIIDYFAAIDPPSYDLLFPDANHFVPPPLRQDHPKIYEEWIRQALHHWHKHHPKLSLRMFRNVCDAVFGYPTESEFFGNGSVSYLILETDGSYHYSDLLKAAFEGASHTGLHVESATIAEVLNAPSIQGFQSQLMTENKCEGCLRCPELNICGSGQIAHRYGPKGFKHPTIYCGEMLTMIQEARDLLFQQRAAQLLENPQAECIMELLFSDQAAYLLGALMQKECSPKYEGPNLILRLLEKAFVSIHQECALFFSPHEMQKASLQNPETLLDELCQRKFCLFMKSYPLAHSGSELEAVYRLAYRFRYFQSLIEELPQGYETAFELKERLVAAIDALKRDNLTEMGHEFLAALMEEFLDVKGKVYVYC